MSLSGQHLRVRDIVSQYLDCRAALRAYFGNPAADPVRFAESSPSEISEDLLARLDELELTQSMIILAAIEAMFRVDFQNRCVGRKRLPLAREFKSLRKAKRERISLDEDILENWKSSGLIAANLIGEIRGAMKLRHWLAHGRYWTAKLGRKYDFDAIVELAEALASSGKLII